jgi:hypothetical protein
MLLSMTRTAMAHPRFALGRILNHAVGYALLGGIASCGGQAGLEPPDTAADSEDVTSTGENPPPTGQTGPGVIGTDSNSPTIATNQPVPTPVSPSDPTIAAPTLQTLSCLDGSVFESMKLTASFDFIALRQVNPYSVDPHQESQALGTPCLNASDAEACRAQLDAAWPDARGAWEECGQGGCTTYAVVLTRGDVVVLYDQKDDLHTLLGTIDDEREAALWADASNYTPRCGETSFARLEDGSYRLQTSEMVSDCPITMATVTFDVDSAGALSELKRDVGPATGACVGRRSPTLVDCERSNGSHAAGKFFADVAALEASAVEAFRLIAAELTAFGAPDELVRAAHEAADDEVRHATITGVLARRHGSEPARATFSDKPLRSLFEFALDNAIEGCVRETYGAACARYQATTAADPAVRALLARIADDEQRHAELSWQIQAWLAPRLTDEENCKLARARERALSELRREVTNDPDAAVIHHAGMPTSARAAAMLDALETSLWATRAAA